MRVIKAVGAAIMLAVMVVGPPWLLVNFIGNPWPAEGVSMSAPLTDGAIIGLLAAAAWVLWAQLAVCILVEALAAVTDDRIQIRVPYTLGAQQHLARQLVTALVVATVSAPVAIGGPARAADAHPPAPAPTTTAPMTAVEFVASRLHAQQAMQAHQADVEAIAHTDQRVTPATQERRHSDTVTVMRLDSLWSISERLLGDGDRWPEIAALNEGRTMNDGTRFVSADHIKPGWTLRVPRNAEAGGRHVSANPDTDEHQVVVQKNDTLAGIAMQELGDPGRYMELFNASTATEQPGGAHLVDPDHIEPNWTITIPGPGHSADRQSPDEHRDAEPKTSHPDPRRVDRHSDRQSPPEQHDQGQDSRPSAASADADQKDDDSVLGAEWVLAGLTGAGVLLAGALFLGLQQRRRARFRARRPGRAIAVPCPDLAPAQMTVTATGGPAAGTVEFIDEALRRLAGAVGSAGVSMPPLAAVELGEATITLHLSDPADLPAPWQGTQDRLHWHCSTEVDVNELGPATEQVEAPYPLLVTIGVSDTGETWLINCEELSTLTISGDPTCGRDFARHLAAQLAVNPWSRPVRVDCLGVAAEAANMDERITYHHSREAAEPAIAEVLAHAVATVDRATGYDTDASTGRTGRVDDDVWPARILLLDAAAGDLPDLERLLDLVKAHAGRAATSIVVFGDRVETPRTVLHMTSNGRVLLHHAGLDLVAVGLTSEEALGCGQIYAQSENLKDREIPVDESAKDGWEAYADQAGGLRHEHTHPRGMPSLEIDEPVASILDAADEDYIRVAAVVPEDLEALARKVPARVRIEVEDADPTLDRDVADWLSADCRRPRLSLLGPITARTHGTAPAKRKPYFTELLAFLALRRRHGVTRDEICDAFGVAPGVARGYIQVVRDWLGANPRTGEPYLPHADKSPSTQVRGLPVYQIDADLLVDVDLFRRLRVRGEARGGASGISDLVKALELVTGRPFDKKREGGWSWLDNGERIDEYMTVAIADVAFVVATADLAGGDVPHARAATELAVLAAPYEETTRLCLVRVTEAEGNAQEAKRILRDEVCNRSDDGGAPTELSKRTEAIIRGHEWLSS